jgi:hypothetical protein|uniref:Uncharacterized protein n=1 Tax=Zea mays TaxID=4577 RepID=A0A804QL51_MAIZE
MHETLKCPPHSPQGHMCDVSNNHHREGARSSWFRLPLNNTQLRRILADSVRKVQKKPIIHTAKANELADDRWLSFSEASGALAVIMVPVASSKYLYVCV